MKELESFMSGIGKTQMKSSVNWRWKQRELVYSIAKVPCRKRIKSDND